MDDDSRERRLGAGQDGRVHRLVFGVGGGRGTGGQSDAGQEDGVEGADGEADGKTTGGAGRTVNVEQGSIAITTSINTAASLHACMLQIQIIPSTRPSLSSRARRAVRIFDHGALDVLERELALEFGFEQGHGGDELRAGLLQDRLRRDAAVGLDLEQKVRVERVRDFVAREEDLGHREQLSGDRVVCWVSHDDGGRGIERTRESCWRGYGPA